MPMAQGFFAPSPGVQRPPTPSEKALPGELRKAQALIDWHKAETVVQALTGDLLPAFGITVD